MSAERVDIKKKLVEYRKEYGLIQKVVCSDEESRMYEEMIRSGKELPAGIVRVYDSWDYENDEEKYVYYREVEEELTYEERMEYLEFEKLKGIKAIKNHTAFFVTLTIISLIASVVLLIVLCCQ